MQHIMKTPFYYLMLLGAAFLLTLCKKKDELRGKFMYTLTSSAKDSLISIGYLEQLNAMRYDLNSDGIVDSPDDAKDGDSDGAITQSEFDNLFTGLAANRASDTPTKFTGYRLARSLNFSDPNSYAGGEALWHNAGTHIANRGNTWDPIGYYLDEDQQFSGDEEVAPFTGVFDGGGFTLHNLYINSPWGYIGLFGYISGGASISHVGLRRCLVKGKGIAVGALVGGSANGKISDCYVSEGSVSGDAFAGGLVGNLRGGSISNCYVSESGVDGVNRVGLLVGYSAENTTVSGCHTSEGSVYGHAHVGNIVGYAEGAVSGCYVLGSNAHGRAHIGGLVGFGKRTSTISDGYVSGVVVTGIGTDTGGLIGGSFGEIRNCYVSESNVSGDRYVGGLAGGHAGMLSYCYASRNSVKGSYAVGGLIGDNREVIKGCYVSGGTVSGPDRVGGLIGDNNNGGTLIACYALGVDIKEKRGVGSLTGVALRSTVNACYVGGRDYATLVGIYFLENTIQNTYFQITSKGTENNQGKKEATIKAPTGYTEIYANWNVDLTGDANPDDPWDFGTHMQYPVLKIDFNNSDGDNSILTGTEDDIARQRM